MINRIAKSLIFFAFCISCSGEEIHKLNGVALQQFKGSWLADDGTILLVEIDKISEKLVVALSEFNQSDANYELFQFDLFVIGRKDKFFFLTIPKKDEKVFGFFAERGTRDISLHRLKHAVIQQFTCGLDSNPNGLSRESASMLDLKNSVDTRYGSIHLRRVTGAARARKGVGYRKGRTGKIPLHTPE